MSNFEERRAAEQLRVTALEYAFRMRGGSVEKTLSTAAQILAFLRGDDVETFQGEEPPLRPGFSSSFLERACRQLGAEHEDDLGGLRYIVVDGWPWSVAYKLDGLGQFGTAGLTVDGWVAFVRRNSMDDGRLMATNCYGERGERQLGDDRASGIMRRQADGSLRVEMPEPPWPVDTPVVPHQAPPDQEHGVFILSDVEAPPARVERIDEDPEDMPF